MTEDESSGESGSAVDTDDEQTVCDDRQQSTDGGSDGDDWIDGRRTVSFESGDRRLADDRRAVGDGGERAAPDAVDLDAPEYYLNRELSELAYQRRVLAEALDDRNPLLERVRFLAIFTRNMDEFFMKRVGGLKQQIDAGITERTVDGLTPREQWSAVIEAARPMFERQTDCYEDVVRPALNDAGMDIVGYEDLSGSEQRDLREYFEQDVLPTLTPLSVDPAHPFPVISNLSLSLAVLTRERGDEVPTFTRVKIPRNLPRLVAIEEGARYVLIEDVVRGNLDLLLPNVEIVEASLFRLTRNAEVRRDEEVAEDLIDMIEEVLEQRRFATVVRLEVETGMSERARRTLREQLDVEANEVFERSGPLDFRDFETLLDLDRPDLKRDPWTPQPHPRLQTETAAFEADDRRPDVFSDIHDGDILLHHPYHSFTDTVQRFLDEAAADPDVLAIKAAIYRTASDSQVIQSLIDAADNGKQVAVMVELKARFDEQNNLEWVRRLEENGIHVAYGTIGLKTHTKTALVVRQEDDGVQLYSHVATGNYHSETAKGYVDLGLLTADRDIGQDLVTLFNFFTGPALDEEFRKLLIAPVTMRDRFTEYIRREARHAREGERARIVAKVNALEDPDIVRELYDASMAGVDIDLLVRDICRLRPGLTGISETVDVYSVVGPFLEHSRIFYFENAGEPEYYIGSADWMTRNLDKRVEAVTPVEDPAIREQLRFVLAVMCSDNRRRWEMGPDGDYHQLTPDGDDQVVDTQRILMDEAARAVDDDERGMACSFPVETDLLVDGEGVSGEDDPDMGPESETVRESADGAVETVRESTADEQSGDAIPEGEGDRAASESGAAGADESADTATASAGGGHDESDLPNRLLRHDEKWYVPDSDVYEFAVRRPSGDCAYRKTADGAASAVERYWG
jgi:polyphosphate kinase